MMDVLSWEDAWEQANTTFYRREIPRDHFETSIHPGPELARALALLAIETDERLGKPEYFDLVDVGAGQGELIEALLVHLDQSAPDLADRCRPVAVDLRPSPDRDSRVAWWAGDARQVLSDLYPEGVIGLVVAHEWLDDIACKVVQRSPTGQVHYVLVDTHSGLESIGDAVAGEDAEWLRRWWWPVIDRAEIGLNRDRAWRAICGLIHRGRAVAIDYGHTLLQRERGEFPQGTVRAFRRGNVVRPIPDGSCNITAHVALDACAHAGGGTWRMSDQREALSGLSIPLPNPQVAGTDPTTYIQQFESHLRVQALRRIPGPGSLGWLVHDFDINP
jgi:SAM-dependent MidA family methyltransferase